MSTHRILSGGAPLDRAEAPDRTNMSATDTSTSRDIDVSFIVVSYNTVDLTRSCLSSIEEQSTGFSYEIIVVDNDSSDGSAEMVAREFPNARLFANKENLGGDSRAIRTASQPRHRDPR
jgi:cellulose synthase/poly-beta-1,6-N-acetylglucosamine synthase-like glycosyltransferase